MKLLFVCTGNLCRSTSAEYLFKHLLAERLHVGVEALPSRGWIIQSAGTMAYRGQDLPEGVRRALASLGVRPPVHASQPVTESLVRAADLVLCAAGEHRAAVVGTWPWA
ncbi:MAG: protein-tyrosine-phosphatase, partial [Candidatus Brocadiae bacterium]|nr:protein-tyrosine-phosphatase [Candidatus Brocadiia bacterium]